MEIPEVLSFWVMDLLPSDIWTPGSESGHDSPAKLFSICLKFVSKLSSISSQTDTLYFR